MTQFDIVISVTSFSSLVGLIGAAFKLFNELKSNKKEADNVKLQILEAVGAVKDKISEQNGDIRVIKTEVIGFKERCNLHLENQSKVNDSLESRIENIELKRVLREKGGR